MNYPALLDNIIAKLQESKLLFEKGEEGVAFRLLDESSNDIATLKDIRKQLSQIDQAFSNLVALLNESDPFRLLDRQPGEITSTRSSPSRAHSLGPRPTMPSTISSVNHSSMLAELDLASSIVDTFSCLDTHMPLDLDAVNNALRDISSPIKGTFSFPTSNANSDGDKTNNNDHNHGTSSSSSSNQGSGSSNSKCSNGDDGNSKGNSKGNSYSRGNRHNNDDTSNGRIHENTTTSAASTTVATVAAAPTATAASGDTSGDDSTRDGAEYDFALGGAGDSGSKKADMSISATRITKLGKAGVPAQQGASSKALNNNQSKLTPGLIEKLDQMFPEFLQSVCSNLTATDPKGEKIHQTQMAKKLQKYSETNSFRPFRFRIQPFINAFREWVVRKADLTEDVVNARDFRMYLHQHRYISRFNENGGKAKSKGQRVWNVEAKKLGENNGWEFKEFTCKIVGIPPPIAIVGVKYRWAPTVWDPQVQVPNATFHSPWLPDWLKWENGVLVGYPPPDAQSCDIVAVAAYDQGHQ
ncbi:hypothetical protein EV182_001583, partial [Spiromyces aspiralis]